MPIQCTHQRFHAYGQYDVAQDGPHGWGRPLRTIVAVGGRDLLLNQTLKSIIGMRKGVFDELMNISPGSSETQSTDTSFLTKFMHFLFESTLLYTVCAIVLFPRALISHFSTFPCYYSFSLAATTGQGSPSHILHLCLANTCDSQECSRDIETQRGKGWESRVCVESN